MDTPPVSVSFPQKPSEHSSFPIVGIGASAGGLSAFQELLRELPIDTGMAYVCVQHLDPTHQSMLADLLGRVTSMNVHQAREDMQVEPDHIYVIPPNTEMLLEQETLKILPRIEGHGLHLPVDRFLSSLANSHAPLTMGVILSGSASDGTLGLQAIKKQGGLTFAQREATATSPGMPHSAIATGDVDFVGSPAEIARELARISRHPYATFPDATEETHGQVASHLHKRALPNEEQEFRRILRLLRQKTNVDFTAYKPTTLKRRILRRMALQHLDNLATYLTYLHEHPTEVDALYQDLLIGVTEFFRHPSTYQALTHSVLPRLLTHHPAREPIRVWVPGCSTGEEVYSLAICLLEFFAEQPQAPLIQLFGTDLNASAIERARLGVYAPDALQNVSQERLHRFFLPIKGNYQIAKSIRDLCVFAQHNLLTDPPFSRLDMLSCQNMLIYLEPGAQKKIIQIFHYAINPQGVLLLGPSETIGTASDLFAPLGEQKKQLYVKKVRILRPPFIDPISTSSREMHGSPEEENHMHHEEGVQEVEIQKEVDRLLLARYAPASVVIDAEMEILHVRGHTSSYLEPAQGRASFNLFKMARDGLNLELRTLLSKVKKSGRPMKKTGIQMSDNNQVREVVVEIIPLKASTSEGSFLILFEDTAQMKPDTSLSSAGDDGHINRVKRGVKDRRIKQLEDELATKSEDMRAIIEAMEASSEELQSANEEILSSNEELQSLNEELETSKEEIQSANEELLIVNQELQLRHTQLQDARAYAEAIVETIREPLLVLSTDLRVQSANQAFYQDFQVNAANTIQQQFFELGNGQWNIPSLRTLLLEILPTNRMLINYEVEHTFPDIGHRTMLLNARRIDNDPLILLAIEDITESKQIAAEKQHLLKHREEFMAIASHELKTPVTTLKGYTQMLHSRFTNAGDEHSTALLAKMETQVNKLISLISELLDITKIEAGKLLWHNGLFDLDALVRDIVEEMMHSTQHQISIEGKIQNPVFGDHEHISQVLTNLLSNAIKYSPQADTVIVKLAVDANAAVVGVQDFGIGIASGKQEHVFDRFFRVSDPEHETFPGLGLGLYISAQIVRQQGGRIWVDSRQGIGSTFFFTIPFTQPPVPGTIGEEGEELHAKESTHR